MGGFFSFPGQTIYGATSAGVKLFTAGLHFELSDTHVQVTVVFPGAIGTNITANPGINPQVTWVAQVGRFIRQIAFSWK